MQSTTNSSSSPVEIRRVVEESSSGPQREAVVGRRVAEAKRIAAMLCDCAVCGGAAEVARGQSTFEKTCSDDCNGEEKSMATRATAAPSVQVAEATAPSRMAATAATALSFLCFLFLSFVAMVQPY